MHFNRFSGVTNLHLRFEGMEGSAETTLWPIMDLFTIQMPTIGQFLTFRLVLEPENYCTALKKGWTLHSKSMPDGFQYKKELRRLWWFGDMKCFSYLYCNKRQKSDCPTHSTYTIEPEWCLWLRHASVRYIRFRAIRPNYFMRKPYAVLPAVPTTTH